MELDDTFIVVATILSFLLCASLFLSVSRQIFSFSFPLFYPLLFLAEAAFTVSPPLALSLSLFLSVCSFYINHITVSHQKRSRKTKPLEEPKQQRMETTQSEWKRKNDTHTHIHTKQPNHRVEMKRNVYIFAHFERDLFCSVKNADMQLIKPNCVCLCVCVSEKRLAAIELLPTVEQTVTLNVNKRLCVMCLLHSIESKITGFRISLNCCVLCVL